MLSDRQIVYIYSVVPIQPTSKTDTAVSAEGNGDIGLQTQICHCGETQTMFHTVESCPLPWQNWMAAYLGYTLRMKTLFRGWPAMVHDTHTRSDLLKVRIIQRQITWKWYNIQLYLQRTTNRKSCMIYRTAPFSVTLNDLDPSAEFFIQLRLAEVEFGWFFG